MFLLFVRWIKSVSYFRMCSDPFVVVVVVMVAAVVVVVTNPSVGVGGE